eukprot:gnl/MRDRNA2_/MRDRNA2_37207_c0_seq2.p1 gnl/MRDRNA2_/MRDRNA2_37207_c0~~gnl/MRDRNA2_/MRDRNA2_37207_c0_seq2.p1  ORF type:complete len:326 (+),score=102.07 gnl/MRDRNA2_/MRDRNA2_37207_c0_seq2:93-1070(+)
MDQAWNNFWGGLMQQPESTAKAVEAADPKKEVEGIDFFKGWTDFVKHAENEFMKCTSDAQKEADAQKMEENDLMNGWNNFIQGFQEQISGSPMCKEKDGQDDCETYVNSDAQSDPELPETPSTATFLTESLGTQSDPEDEDPESKWPWQQGFYEARADEKAKFESWQQGVLPQEAKTGQDMWPWQQAFYEARPEEKAKFEAWQQTVLPQDKAKTEVCAATVSEAAVPQKKVKSAEVTASGPWWTSVGASQTVGSQWSMVGAFETSPSKAKSTVCAATVSKTILPQKKEVTEWGATSGPWWAMVGASHAVNSQWSMVGTHFEKPAF